MNTDTRANVPGMDGRLAEDRRDLRLESAAGPGGCIRTRRPGHPALPRGGNSLLGRMAAFMAALALITVALHFVGGAAGHWAEQQWAPETATSSASGR